MSMHTFFAVCIVNAFLMRAADDAIDGRLRFGTMMIDESNDCFGDFEQYNRLDVPALSLRLPRKARKRPRFLLQDGDVPTA
jgi:hypothetical protein